MLPFSSFPIVGSRMIIFQLVLIRYYSLICGNSLLVSGGWCLINNKSTWGLITDVEMIMQNLLIFWVNAGRFRWSSDSGLLRHFCILLETLKPNCQMSVFLPQNRLCINIHQPYSSFVPMKHSKPKSLDITLGRIKEQYYVCIAGDVYLLTHAQHHLNLTIP